METFLASAFSFGEIFGNFLTKWYLYAALLVVAAAVFIFLALKKQHERNRLTPTQKLCYIAVLTAVTTAVNCLTYYPVSYIAISFTATTCFIAGYLLGAKAGFAVGFLGDLIGAIIFPAGAYNPLIGLASGLMGFIPGAVFSFFKGSAVIKTVISAVLCLLICTSGINTFGLWLMYAIGKKTFFVYLFARLPFQLIVASGNCALCIGLTYLLPKVLPKDKFILQEPTNKQ